MDAFGWKDIATVMGMGDGRRSDPTKRETTFLDAIKKYQAEQSGQPMPAPPASSVGAGNPSMQMPVNPGAMPQDIGSGMGAVAQALAYRANQPQTPDQVAAAADPWSGMRRQPMGFGRLFGQGQ